MTSTAAPLPGEHPTDRALWNAEWAPPVTVVLDPGDDVAVTRAALAAHSPTRGRITVDPTPATGQPAASLLGSDVLVALGKPAALLSAQQVSGGQRAWQAAAAWILGDSVAQLIVLRGHRLDRAAWAQLAALRRHTGIHLVVICHHRELGAAGRDALRKVPHHITHDLHPALADATLGDRTGGELEDSTTRGCGDPPPEPGRQRPLPDHTDEPGLPRLPASEVIRFRADAWRRLSAEEFARVDACYTLGLHTVERWLREQPPRPRRPGGNADRPRPGRPPEPSELHATSVALLPPPEPDDGGPHRDDHGPCHGERASDGNEWEALQLLLSELTATSPSPRHTLARLRGAQAGFLRQGRHLALPARLTQFGGPGLGPATFTDDVAARIRARATHPVAAATLAVAAFTDLDHDTIHQLPPDALAADVAVLRVHPDTQARNGPVSVAYYVPPAARSLLRAAVAYRNLREHPTPYLLGPAAAATTIAAFHTAAEACALPAPTDNRPRPESAGSWLALAACHEISDPLPPPRGQASRS